MYRLTAPGPAATRSDRTQMRLFRRIVGADVASAHGAAEFYGKKISEARDLTSRLANDDRGGVTRTMAEDRTTLLANSLSGVGIPLAREPL
jgi:hypothetical protein